jgi:NAD(P)-dependent dehydrogenase (short-subunit alcohol dehydrogenase family)
MPLANPPSALVTGATGAMGQAVAERLAARGYRLLLTGRREPVLSALAAKPALAGARPDLLAADLASQEGMGRLTQWLAGQNPVDVFVHCAGDGPVGDAVSSREADWQHTLDSKLLSAVRIVRCILPRMMERRSGRIVFMNGVFALTPHEAFAVNAAVNGALRGYAKALASFAGRHGICVNTINPGITAGPLWEEIKSGLADRSRLRPEEISDALLGQIPLGRFIQPSEIAAAVDYLISPEAYNVNGATLTIDGGACGAA